LIRENKLNLIQADVKPCCTTDKQDSSITLHCEYYIGLYKYLHVPLVQ